MTRQPASPAWLGRLAAGRRSGAVPLLMNMMHVRHLIAVYRMFGGDLLAAIVLGEVAHHNLAALLNAARTPRDLEEAIRSKGSALAESFLPTNTFSIAQATGIPRETVRRKVASLARRGWLVKDRDGNLFVAATTEAAFKDFHAERLRDLVETTQAIETLLDDR